MAVLWFIIIVQFGLISWLVTDKYKPKAVDYWDKAQQMVERWKADDATNWELDFKKAQGLIEAPKPVEQPHAIIDVSRSKHNDYMKGWLFWTCQCGHTGENTSASMMNMMFEQHVANEKEIAKYRKS